MKAFRHVLDGARRQRDHRVALLSTQPEFETTGKLAPAPPEAGLQGPRPTSLA